jgi:phosphoribosylaminoimidazole-succinocarboxamide synthase
MARSPGSRCARAIAWRTAWTHRLFTPARKAETGHDENISFEQMAADVGADLAARLRDLTLGLYQAAAAHALSRGIILADTKFEFGLDEQQRVLLIDEVLTPDSSRYWPADRYQPGGSPPSFDKQFVRDYLETLAWDKRPPAPALPPRWPPIPARLTGKPSSA